MLQAMEDWARNAAKKHATIGHLKRSDRTARELEVFAALCKRIREDDYSHHLVIFPKVSAKFDFEPVEDSELDLKQLVIKDCVPSKEVYNRVIKININHTRNQRKRDLAYLCKLMEKQLFGWWD